MKIEMWPVDKPVSYEKNARNCEAIVKRWHHFTGKPANLEHGRTFAQLESKRENAERA